MRFRRRRPAAVDAEWRAEFDAWVQRVAAFLPDGPIRDVWLDFPAGNSVAVELDARLRVLEDLVAHVEAGGTLERWDDLLP